LKFISAVNSLLFSRRLLVFMFLLLFMSETFSYSMFASLAKIFLLVDALQLIMLVVGALIYLEPKLFLSIIF
jgi:hypothetical protein